MAKFKLARGQKKAPPPKFGAVGCVLVVVVLLALFMWFFSGALQPR